MQEQSRLMAHKSNDQAPSLRKPQEHMMERTAKVLTILKQYANNNLPCPTDATLAERLNVKRTTIGNAIAFLVTAGAIEIQKFGRKDRIITIRATGAKTQRSEP